ncbi:MAG: AAA family ATPase, partial [Oscillospiraceae bacterium]|nr:AAA family ATPase [Oscillospiraceae bacterium]
IIILTSNLGSEYLLDGIDAEGNILDSAKDAVNGLLRRSFRPEFLNRLDEIVFYKPLTRENIGAIIDLQIAQLNRRLESQQLRIEVTEKAKDFIVAEAYDPVYGARPLRRYVQHTIETKLSKLLLAGRVLPGSTVTADAVDGGIVLN